MAFAIAAFHSAEGRQAVQALLARSGHTVAHFRTGAAAVAGALAKRPDIMIADTRLADMSPVQLGDALRARPETAGIPLILCGSVDAESKRMAQDLHQRVFRALLTPRSLQSVISAALAVRGGSPDAAVAPRSAGDTPTAAAPATGEQWRVLLVEDDDSIADPLVEGLARYGITADRVATGVAALAAPPATMVLLDLGLPDIDGIDVFQQLRHTTDVPVIMLTARGDEADRVRGLELGADDYLGKPFSIRELVARMRAVNRRSTTAAANQGRITAPTGLR